jgi:hypothetical protein
VLISIKFEIAEDPNCRSGAPPRLNLNGWETASRRHLLVGGYFCKFTAQLVANRPFRGHLGCVLLLFHIVLTLVYSVATAVTLCRINSAVLRFPVPV